MYQTNHPDRGRLRRFFSRTLLCTSAAFLCTGAQTALAELKQPHIVRPAEVLPFGSGVGSAFRPAFRDATGSSLTFSVVELDSNGLLLDRTRLGTGLWEKYQQSLMKETKRSLRRDPSLFWPEHEFEDEIDARRERYAERIFGKANNRLLSGMAEMVIDQSPRLRNAYDYISGFEFGGKRERSALDDREGDDSVPGEARSLRNDFRVVVDRKSVV